jgi:phage gp36-like protein
MPYADKQDMLLRFGETEVRQLTDLAVPSLGATDDAVLTKALGDASAWIDGYLVGRYSLPITNPTALATLNVHCCNVARFQLMSTRADEQATAMYKSAEAFLTRVATGTITLIPPAEAPAAAGMGDVEVFAGTKHFGRDD